MKQSEKMDRAAILHIPLSQYAYAVSEYGLTIRLRAKKGDLTRCTLYTADRVCKTTPISFSEIPMNVCAVDEFYDYYETTVRALFKKGQWGEGKKILEEGLERYSDASGLNEF